jgi:hypothetical protein
VIATIAREVEIPSLRELLCSITVLASSGGALCLPSNALAQATRPSSVLPTGDGQGLLDASDTALLLLDHRC